MGALAHKVRDTLALKKYFLQTRKQGLPIIMWSFTWQEWGREEGDAILTPGA